MMAATDPAMIMPVYFIGYPGTATLLKADRGGYVDARNRIVTAVA
jgi:hypothetical protein